MSGHEGAHDPEDLDPDDADAEALSWAGDESRGRATSRIARVAGSADGIGADGNGADGNGPDSEPDSAAAGAAGGLLLIGYGILAGAYAIFTAGWITTVFRSTTTLANLPAEILYQFGEFLAIALPLLWFVAVLRLETKPPRRLLWLLIGIPLVLPWPWVLGQ